MRQQFGSVGVALAVAGALIGLLLYVPAAPVAAGLDATRPVRPSSAPRERL